MDQYGNVILVRLHLATGNGLSIGRAREFLRGNDGEVYFLPAQTVRGTSPATEAELAAVPDWVRAAYEWWNDGCPRQGNAQDRIG
jgi:hypothetical protein